MGDDSSPNTLFGAQVLMSTPANRMRASLQFSHVELSFVGQAFRLGRYPIHWHMHGDGSASWVKGCSIHHSYQRAITIHGTHRVLLKVRAETDHQAGAGRQSCICCHMLLSALQLIVAPRCLFYCRTMWRTM